MPIVGGESWAFLDEFEEVLDRGAAGSLQPDLTSAGGITSTRRIVAAGAACNTQVLATIPGEPMFEFDRTPNPLRDDLVQKLIENEGMSVPVPDRPGIGITIDPDTIERFRID